MTFFFKTLLYVLLIYSPEAKIEVPNLSQCIGGKLTANFYLLYRI
jgi:hypothetical protein